MRKVKPIIFTSDAQWQAFENRAAHGLSNAAFGWTMLAVACSAFVALAAGVVVFF
jgi:hypothetical protein